jgi:cell division protein FtsI (penicillin-binding protein 3)
VFDKLDIGVDEKNISTEWVSTSKKNNKIEYSTRRIINKLVPNVVDMGLRDAMFLLENAGLRVIVKGRGKVVNQSIMPGTQIIAGATIILEMSLG